jgi:hypothetical protein
MVGTGTKRYWRNQDNVAGLSWRDSWKSRNISIRVICLSAEAGTWCIPSALYAVPEALLLVGRSRDRSPAVSLGIFSVASDNCMCPGSTQPPKMSTRLLLGEKRPVRTADNLPPSSADVTESGSLKLPAPSGPHRPVMGLLYLFFYLTLSYCMNFGIKYEF